MGETCKECNGPARVAFHLDVIAAYTANLRQCVRSGRMSYCGNVAPVVSGIIDRRSAFRERLVAMERAAGNLGEAQAAALHENHGWRHRALMCLADARMYMDRAETIIQGDVDD